MTLEPGKPILTPKEAAQLCGVCVRTLYRAGIPYVQFTPQRRRFLLEDILAYMKERAA